ncbi:hypothetical protein C5167_026072 [Papaver somniferum]|nr:hypothetical protein C5167_026072 [Papaver somniferum]
MSGMQMEAIVIQMLRVSSILRWVSALVRETAQTNKLCSISLCDSNSMLNEIYRGSTVPESCFIDNPTTSWLDGIIIWILQKLLVVVVRTDDSEALKICRSGVTNPNGHRPGDIYVTIKDSEELYARHPTIRIQYMHLPTNAEPIIMSGGVASVFFVCWVWTTNEET